MTTPFLLPDYHTFPTVRWPHLFYYQVDGPFSWMDGSPWDFTNWDDGEPDRKSIHRSHHEYATLLRYTNLGKFIVCSCSWFLYYLFYFKDTIILTCRCVFMGKNTAAPGKWSVLTCIFVFWLLYISDPFQAQVGRCVLLDPLEVWLLLQENHRLRLLVRAHTQTTKTATKQE